MSFDPRALRYCAMKKGSGDENTCHSIPGFSVQRAKVSSGTENFLEFENPTYIPRMSRAHMLYNDTAISKILNIKWKEQWQEENVFRVKQGQGVTIEGKVKEKSRISITDPITGKISQHYTVINLVFSRAYKRSFDNSGVEIEPWKSATKKVNTGYLMSSYKTVELETSAITLRDLLVLVNLPEFDGHLSKLEPNTVRVFCNDSSLGNLELDVGESVRLKTKGNGPYVEYIARLDEGKYYLYWTDSVMQARDNRKINPLSFE